LVNFEGDHFRTRLTHTLEVAQIARTIARALHVNEDLAETVALAHDLGHSPFGHAGEAALDAAAEAVGGFDHNVQTFRVVTRLEQRYAAFDGLNLTAETLEGVLKHAGPLRGAWPAAVVEHPQCADLRLDEQAPIEAQAAGIADDVAYCNHDLDDGLRAGFFTLDDLAPLPLLGPIVAELRLTYPDLRHERLVHETVRRLIDRMVGDLIARARAGLAALDPQDADAVRRAPSALVGFSGELREAVRALRGFLHERMYRHYKVNRMALKAGRLVTELYATLVSHPHCLPGRWREAAGDAGSARAEAAVRDYIAGMTDRYAVDEHERLFRLTSWSA
ncbi:MAG: dNTP triphosphohydrolase, partial [Geminicoccaceae bacterium]|nr:dNTP triphosphohydrolase [Geminicoccaceae bacterium]